MRLIRSHVFRCGPNTHALKRCSYLDHSCNWTRGLCTQQNPEKLCGTPSERRLQASLAHHLQKGGYFNTINPIKASEGRLFVHQAVGWLQCPVGAGLLIPLALLLQEGRVRQVHNAHAQGL